MAVVKKSGKRRNPYYWCLSTGQKDENGKYILIWSEKGFPEEKLAEIAEAEAKIKLFKGIYVEPNTTSLSTYLFDVYLPTKAKIGGNTKKTYEHFCNRVKANPIGSLKICDLRPMHFVQYKSYLVSLGLSDKSLRDELGFLKGAMSFAEEKEIIEKNPARTLKLPQKQKPKGKHLKPEVMLQQLEFIKKHDYEIFIPVMLMGTCGCRTSESVAGALDDFRLREKIFSIRHSLKYIDGILQPAGLKTDAAYREVPLLEYACTEIIAWTGYIEQHKKSALTVHLKDGSTIIDMTRWKNDLGLLWCATDDGRPLSKDFLAKRFRKLKKKYPNDLLNIRLYDFRHSYAAGLRDAGVSMADISELMGHTDLSFTLKTYARPIERVHSYAAEKLESKMLAKKAE